MLFQVGLGVDIQNGSVSVAYLKDSLKGLRLAAHAIYPLEKEGSAKEKMDQISGLVRNFLVKNHVSSTGIFLGIPRDLVVLRYTELPLAVKESLMDTLGYEIEKYVPFSANEVCFDYQIVSEDRESGKMRLLLMVVKRSDIDPYLDLGNQLGLRISGIEVRSTAMANYFSWQQGKDGRDVFALVYLADDNLEIDFFRNRILDYSRFVRLPEKRDELDGFILQELRKLKGTEGQGQERLETLLCVPETDSELYGFLRDEGIDGLRVDLAKTGIPSFTMIPAYGLALKGIRKVSTDINLLPDEFRKRPSKIPHYTMFVLMGLFILSAATWGGGNIVSQQLHLSKLDSEISRLRAEGTNFDRIRKKCNDVENKIDYLNTLRGGSPSVLNIIRELSQRVPKSAWISKFTFSAKGVEIEGWAKSASELIPVLETSPLFQDVSFRSSITRNKAGNERFRIGLNSN